MTAATRAIESDIKDFERTCDPATRILSRYASSSVIHGNEKWGDTGGTREENFPQKSHFQI